MTNEKPTQEQIKKFWEWCGFRRVKDSESYWQDPIDSFHTSLGLPEINLNNLFRYAVPKLMDDGISYLDIQVRRNIVPNEGFRITYHAEIYSDSGRGTKYGNSKDPAVALFLAIWEVINDK